MKTSVGIIKEIDKLGRIVIPKEFRERYGVNDSVEIVPTESGIVIRNPEYKLVKINNDDFNEKKEDGIAAEISKKE